MLASGITEADGSQWASPIAMARKQTGEWRGYA